MHTDHTLEHSEDDIKSLFSIIKVNCNTVRFMCKWYLQYSIGDKQWFDRQRVFSLYRSSVTCSTLKALTNRSLTCVGKVSVSLRSPWRTRLDTHLISVTNLFIWHVVDWHSLFFSQLHGSKQHIRALLIDRVMLQHEVIRNNIIIIIIITFYIAFRWISQNLSKTYFYFIYYCILIIDFIVTCIKTMKPMWNVSWKLLKNTFS